MCAECADLPEKNKCFLTHELIPYHSEALAIEYPELAVKKKGYPCHVCSYLKKHTKIFRCRLCNFNRCADCMGDGGEEGEYEVEAHVEMMGKRWTR